MGILELSYLEKYFMFGFPNFRAWRNAALLFIPSYGAATVVFGFAFWLFFLTFCVSLIRYATPFFFFLGISLITLVIALIWYLSIDFLYLSFLRLLWNSPPKFFLSPPSLKQKSTHFGVAISATFPLAVVYIISFLWKSNLKELMRINYETIYAPDFILKFSWLWLIAATYIYHWKYLVENRR